ncbi:arsenate reductase/protein-tyrosine-phosphatase family protein [Rhodohalobacter sp. 8-1]|uniref:arsenate reductase/protein-tyrosine-phosphatase family protein n=1 Tax=Rhodohalobacter sp. 8-1 TaxID=3131972 RepID=UPI0030ECF06B
MYKKLKTTIEELKKRFDEMPSDRKKLLSDVADFIKQELKESETVKLNFICTHNSRRSHLAQIWAQTAAEHYDIENVETYSGGTEATAFNPRAVAAVERAGFDVENSGGDNPKYSVRFSDNAEPMICFSKTFDDPVNPDKDFAAIMTCSDADENCPFVPGATYRKSITYRDPKEADGTDREKETYDERCRQIGTEMFYMMSRANI